jgi:carboxypeptidase C (cathepsin A)
MTGKYDQRINHEKAKTLYPDLICFNHSAHMIPLEEPKKCAGVVKSFIFDNNTSNQFLSL